MIRWNYTRDVAPWVPSPALAAVLGRLVASPITVYVHARRDAPRVWMQTHGPSARFPGPWAFRAWTRGNVVRVFADETETPHSIAWLLLHELAHTQVPRSPMLATGLRDAPRHPDYLTSDAAHEADLEERLANQVADTWASRLGLTPGLNRLWWRKRVRGRHHVRG